MDPTLYECALNGDVDQLKALIDRDAHLLERSETANSKGNNILHVAAIYGRILFTHEVLTRKPELSIELNEAGLSPLHLAAAKGHLDLVKLLLAFDPDLSSVKDKHGRHPAHTAAMKGKLDVLTEILSVNPWCLKETTDKGETVLHLSAKEGKAEVVQYLLGREEIEDIVNEGDCNGNTALHLAAARNRKEVIRILTNASIVRVNASNKYNITPLELFNQQGLSSMQNTPEENDEIRNLLNPTNASASGESSATDTNHDSTETVQEGSKKARSKLEDNAMVVFALIATVTFQAAVTPPGGFWQDNSPADSTMKAVVGASSPFAPTPSVVPTSDSLAKNHTAGTSVLHPLGYDQFMNRNTNAFMCSTLAIVVLVLSAVLPTPCMRCFSLLGTVLAMTYLSSAFYYAIETTEPLGSDASKALISKSKWVVLGIVVYSSAIRPLSEVAKYVRKKLRLPRL